MAADRSDSSSLFEIDHRFHQAIATAAHNRYLAQTLETFFGLSLRLWYMALPRLKTLPGAVEKHLELADAIRRGDAAAAEQTMRAHVAGFYDDVRGVLGSFASGSGPSGNLPPLSSTEDVEVRRAYAQIRERIITLALAPGAAIKPERLAGELKLSPAALAEALELLAHEGLVSVTPPQEHGAYVAIVHLADLDQLSETRLRLEALSARLAAQRATADDLTVLDALCAEQSAIPPDDATRLLDVDHKLHQAIAAAASNLYLAGALDHLFGLSQRLWYLALPALTVAEALPVAMRKHTGLVDAIRARDLRPRSPDYGRARIRVLRPGARLLTAHMTVSYGNDVRSVTVEQGSLLSEAIIATGLPIEQPCAGAHLSRVQGDRRGQSQPAG
jgi:DNA-binding GntR family transcriptional regulator